MRAGPTGYIVQVLQAAEFAAHKHKGQRRKGETRRPYIGHCLEVARMIAEIAKSDDPTILSAAILHDTLEDTDTTREELIEAFGERVTDFVVQVTVDKSLPKKQRKKSQIEHAAHLSPGAKLIKLADKISNVRELGEDPRKDWSRKKLEKYFKWAKDVVESLGSVNADLEKAFAATVKEAEAKLEPSGDGDESLAG
jgi:guanosine-3',5'-bis(diphosphate) 3'-pyrophosphohydrolase